jgi:hypothetical protein
MPAALFYVEVRLAAQQSFSFCQVFNKFYDVLGTLRPHDDLLNQLVNTLECSYYYKNGETVKNEIKNSEEAGHMAVPVAMFSCNHVIPPENLLGTILLVS